MATRAHVANRPSTTIQIACAATVHCIVDRQQIHIFHAVVTKCTAIEISCVATAATTNEAAAVRTKLLSEELDELCEMTAMLVSMFGFGKRTRVLAVIPGPVYPF